MLQLRRSMRFGRSVQRLSLVTRYSSSTAAPNNSNGQRLFPEEINMLYDSKCQLCLMEVRFLARCDTQGKIRFTDLEDEKYNPSDAVNANIDYATGMKYMHAVRYNGEVIKGVEVFHALYSEIGLGWMYSFIKLPVLKEVVGYIYDSWAQYRTDLTRGESVESLIKKRNDGIQAKLKAALTEHCADDRCKR